MICNNCGTQNKRGAKYCSNCGQPLPQATPPPHPTAAAASQGKKVISPLLWAALGALSIFALCMLLFLFNIILFPTIPAAASLPKPVMQVWQDANAFQKRGGVIPALGLGEGVDAGGTEGGADAEQAGKVGKVGEGEQADNQAGPQDQLMKNPDGQKLNCSPKIAKDFCQNTGGTWTVNQGVGEEYCLCDKNNPKEECETNDGLWLGDDEKLCTYLKVPAPNPPCYPTYSKDQCNSVKADWMVNQTTGEDYCLCDKSNPKGECEKSRGIWMEKEQRCSLRELAAQAQLNWEDGCKDLKTIDDESYFKSQNDVEKYYTDCQARGGFVDGHYQYPFCICPTKDTTSSLKCDWVNDVVQPGNVQHKFDGCQYYNNYYKSRYCDLDISTQTGDFIFKQQSQIPTVVIKLKKPINNGLSYIWDTCLSENGHVKCRIAIGDVKNSIPAENIEEIYLCNDLCCIDLLKLEKEGKSACPSPSNLNVEDFKWGQKGKISFGLRNTLAWQVDKIDPIILKDSQGKDWTKDVEGTLNESDKNLMDCKGWAKFKSGSGSLGFSIGSDNQTCTVTDVKFAIPDLCPQGTTLNLYTGQCCAPGLYPCPCGCRHLGGSYTTCESACS